MIYMWGDKGLTSMVAVEIKGIENRQELVIMDIGSQKKNELMVTD